MIEIEKGMTNEQINEFLAINLFGLVKGKDFDYTIVSSHCGCCNCTDEGWGDMTTDCRYNEFTMPVRMYTVCWHDVVEKLNFRDDMSIDIGTTQMTCEYRVVNNINR